MILQRLLERLEGVRGNNGQHHARCPAHDDHQASLTVAEGRDGQILITCWAGCTLEDIVRAIGLQVRDLFPSRDDQALHKTPPWGDRTLGEAVLPLEDEIARMTTRLLDDPVFLELLWARKGWHGPTLAAIGTGKIGDRLSIPIRDVDGHLVNHLRYQPDGQPKMLATKGRPRTPYYQLFESDQTVWIVEGETDAISLTMVGFSVIGIPGATAKARAQWLEPVQNKHAIVCMDNDQPGRGAARRWAQAAHDAHATDVRVVELEGPPGYDVGDLVREGRDNRPQLMARLLGLAKRAAVWESPARAELSAPTPSEPVRAGENGRIGEIVTTSLAGIRTKRVRWLWRDRVPRGRVGIIFGPPGQGKSTFTALLTADITRAGDRVLIASAEDNAATTIVPRLAAADAALDHVELIETKASKGTTSLVLPRDLDALGERMAGRALLIIDPLSAHLGDDVNAWSEQSVRSRVLAPLSWHANKTGCSVALIMHLNKSDKGDPLTRISGSGGFGGAARFALLLGIHPDDVGIEDELEQRLVLVHVKASEGPRHGALIFRRHLVQVTHEHDEITDIPMLQLIDDRTWIDADLVLASTDPDERGAYTEALLWLRRELSVGPQLAKRLLGEARERGDFSERTLRRAKRALRVHSEREAEGWFWVMGPPS